MPSYSSEVDREHRKGDSRLTRLRLHRWTTASWGPILKTPIRIFIPDGGVCASPAEYSDILVHRWRWRVLAPIVPSRQIGRMYATHKMDFAFQRSESFVLLLLNFPKFLENPPMLRN
ncbi:hypothetical protein Y032_0012g1874 [Ancylostoma ceylanicum]|nr:hypothetical protein Y032_0012g1874 [Ancylostoma ceylanicum]